MALATSGRGVHNITTIFAVPADGPQDNMTLKMPTFEWVHVLLLQLNSGISLPSPDLCNSASKLAT